MNEGPLLWKKKSRRARLKAVLPADGKTRGVSARDQATKTAQTASAAADEKPCTAVLLILLV
jgi:hypothetical protein